VELAISLLVELVHQGLVLLLAEAEAEQATPLLVQMHLIIMEATVVQVAAAEAVLPH
jgi:hypothetical protein